MSLDWVQRYRECEEAAFGGLGRVFTVGLKEREISEGRSLYALTSYAKSDFLDDSKEDVLCRI